MQAQRELLTKITRPDVRNILIRKGLFRQIDGLRRGRSLWVTGPAGSGKTTLVSSYIAYRNLPCLWYRIDEGDSDISSFFYYLGIAAKKAPPRSRKHLPLLTPEYAMGTTAFARRYFEELWGMLALRASSDKDGGFVVVFDDYQEVASQSGLHSLICQGLSRITEGISVVLLSRSKPPPVFSRLYANNQMKVLGWDNLRLTRQETKEIVRARGLKLKTDEIASIYDKTMGWAAGITLMLENAHPNISKGLSFRGNAPAEVFDYFASEIFERMKKQDQDFLIATSVLPHMDARMAAEQTGRTEAGRILASLSRNHFFTEKHPDKAPVYTYHPLFREFLMERMRESQGPREVNSLLDRAAAVLESAGEIQYAVALYRDSANWKKLVALVLGNAQALIEQGRNATLSSWLAYIPEEIKGSAPWLLYWLGICHLGYDFVAARKELERAFNLFLERNDPLGTVLTWSFIMIAIQMEFNNFFAYDKWIDAYFEIMEKALPSAPLQVQARAISSLGMALTIRKPGDSRTKDSIERSLSLARQTGDIEIKMQASMVASTYYSWTGAFPRCRTLDDQASRPLSPAHASHWFRLTQAIITAGKHIWDVPDPGDIDRRISGALELGEKTGIRIFDDLFYFLGAYGALITGNMEKARLLLEKTGSVLIPDRKESHVQYHFINSLYQFLSGNFPAALAEIETGLEIGRETGFEFARIICLYAKAQVLHALKDNRSAECLEQALDGSVLSGSAILEFGCRLAKAQFALDSGYEGPGAGLLRMALALGKRHGYKLLLWWWDPAAMSRLCAKALEYGIETDYVTDLINSRRLIPEGPAVHIENWPWPLKIYTLGTFMVEKDAEPLVFSSKVQQRPLSMLKAMIALGGKEIRQEQLFDLLWPEAEGDAAHNAFKMALSRLRRLIGNEAVEFRGGKISLKAGRCWVDALAFERAFLKAEETQVEEMEKAFALYKGQFLSQDTRHAWIAPMRERLQNKYLGLIRALGRHREQSGNYEKAAQYYRRAIEVDGLAEEFYQHLISCHMRLGRRAEAISVYHHCKKILADELGIKPAPETEVLYKRLMSARK